MGAGAGLIAPVGLALARPAPSPQTTDLRLSGKRVQGGFVMGRARPGETIEVDGTALSRASRTGLFVVGFDRDSPLTTTVASVGPDAASGHLRVTTEAVALTPGTFPSSRIDGLPPSTVEPSDPDLLARIQRETALKAQAFQSCADTEDFAEGFVWPLETYRVSSLWGAQRVLNGTPARPHYGIDLAAPEGTPIHAPAPGFVVLAEPDLHFEGGLVLIDHGQGLITAYLHQSRLEVTVGQTLARGDLIGRVGMKGRATGPHLCWRMKWRDRNLDPSLMIGAIAPQV
jgi:murein DD-endopeptidase MepM/ murein hydrolase activator NlpD